jgi:tetratricopeptide (TPR) repeat protein
MQLAGLISMSELGANDGATHLHEAFVIPGTTIRSYLERFITRAAVQTEHLDPARLKDILAEIGATEIPVSEIPNRLRQYIEAAKAHAAEPAPATNDGADIDAAIGASREKLANLDSPGARMVLQTKIDEEKKERAHRLLPLLTERLKIEQLSFDHIAAKSTLSEILQLEPHEQWPHIALGQLWQTTGDLERALDSYRASLAIAETLARRDPANSVWQRDLSVSHNKIGDVLLSEGKRDEALAAYRASLAIRETLARRDPANSEWQRDLIVSQSRMAEVEPNQAKSHLAKALERARRLESEGRLAPADAWMVEDLSQRLSRLQRGKRKAAGRQKIPRSKRTR